MFGNSTSAARPSRLVSAWQRHVSDANMDHDGSNLGFYLRYKSSLWWDVQYIDRTRMPVVVDH